jgi:hypothetical protein
MKLLTRILLAGLAVAALSPVYGTLVPRLSFEELVGQSEAVVHGRVVSVHVAWDADHASIWTHYEVQVDDSLKGTPGALVAIQEPGGELDGLRMEIVGAPRYAVGEEVIVFAAQTPGGLRTCGWGQGRFVVDGEVGQKRVRNDRGAIQLVSPQGRPLPSRATALPDAALGLFKQRVRAEVLRQQN